MDILPLIFIVLVVLLGGVVALLADRLGRKLGKKRISFRKLRPKQTAELFVVGAGMLIPLVTVGILFAGSRDFREWVSEGARAIEQRNQLRKEVSDLQDEQKQLHEQSAVAHEQLANRQKEVERLTGERDKLDDEAQKARRQMTSLGGQIKNLNAQYGKVVALERSARQDVEQQRKELGTKRKELVQLNQSFQVLHDQQEEAFEYNKQLQDENKKLEDNSKQLQSDISRVQREIKTKEEDIRRAELTLDGYQRDLLRLINEINAKAREVTELEAEVSELAKQREALAIGIVEVRTSPIMFAVGEEVGRVQVPSHLSRVGAQELANSLFRSVRVLASDRGAKPPASTDVTAGFFEYTTKDQTITVQQQEEELLRSMTGREQAGVLIARAAFNVYKGEYLPLRVGVLDNPLVYREGQIISEGRIDGSQTDEVVFSQISEFLRQQVNSKAANDKMIPVQTATEASYGQVTPGDIIALVSRIRGANRPVRLVAYVEQDTRAGDPLKLAFRLR